MNDAIRMQISAFVDGELPDNEADLLLRRMGQDAELRKMVADYLAIGRAMRGESTVPGVDRIHERVSAEIDDKPLVVEPETAANPATRAIRPLLGVVVTASVALLAIFGLQQTTGVNAPDTAVPDSTLAETVEEVNYTAPETIDDQLLQYYISHGAENGDSFFASRDVAGWLGAQTIDEQADGENEALEQDAETADDTPAER